MQILKVFGPPGTGKTRRMLEVMEQELKAGVRPDRLAYLTFTVQARREALERATKQFNLTTNDLPYFRTLHSICYRELGITGKGLIRGPEDMRDLAESLAVKFSYRPRHGDQLMMEVPTGGEVGDRLMQLDHLRRHRLQPFEQTWKGTFDDDLNVYQIRRFLSEYSAWKHREGLLDFTDLLELIEHPIPVDVVIVDEAQDLSRLQWQALGKLAANCERLYLAGDDDQAIFTWAGASPEAFLEHPGKVQVLHQSYRVPAEVQVKADLLIRDVKPRQPKTWNPRPGASKVSYAADGKVPLIDMSKRTLLLYRHHYLSKHLEEEVRARGLPYTRGDYPAPGAEWGRAIVYWERLRKGQNVVGSEARYVVDAVAVGQGITKEGRQRFLKANRSREYSLSELRQVADLTIDGPWFEALTKILPADRQYLRQIIREFGAKALTNEPNLRLSTIHAAKGAEADHVVLLTEITPRVLEKLHTHRDQERRVFYVGVTRTKEQLTIVGDSLNLLYSHS